MKVLVFNCGSSSIKYQLYDMPDGTVLAKGMVERIGEDQSLAKQTAGDSKIQIERPIKDHDDGLIAVRNMLTNKEKGAIADMSEIGACGHRVVHGGEAFTGSVTVTPEIEKVIEEHFELAPLHNPPNMTGIQAAKRMLEGTPQIACFDTAFHQSIPKVAYLYALPYEFYEKHRIRRYGFHGTSHRYVARRATSLMEKGKYEADVITCHLGNGCSIAAVKNGNSVDTSMGLTPLEGLVMGTRTGDIDPAITFFLGRKGFEPDEMDNIFNKKSGLLGISGISNDVRDLEEKAEQGNEMAKLALEIFAYRIKKYIGTYMAVLNSCHAIVMTGGIGENGVAMRTRILSELNHLGIELDAKKNAEVVGREGEIQTDTSSVKLYVIPTNEEGAIARDTYQIATGRKPQIQPY